MATYYIDPENHTGSASDTAGGGTSTASPYLNLSFAFSDVVATHGKTSTGDTFKMIGTYAPDDTESTACGTNWASYGGEVILISDGATSFGTHGPNSRATISGANLVSNTVVISGGGNARDCFVSGFNLTNPPSSYILNLGYSAVFDNLYADISSASNVSLLRGLNSFIAQNCFFKVAASSGFIVGVFTGHSVLNNIFILSKSTDSLGLGLTATGANSVNRVIGNTFILNNGANAFSPNASDCVFNNNLVVGNQASSNSCAVIGWAQFPNLSICNNHFENLHAVCQHVANTGTVRSPGVRMFNNTYHNVTYVETNDPSYTSTWEGITRNNVQLSGPGVLDALNEDLRPTNARVGATAFSQMPITSADWSTSMTNGSPIMPNNAAIKIRDIY
jgi:hypothetical protein